MTEAERNALTALDDLIDYKAKHWGADHEETAHWVTLKAMLAMPVLPEEPTPEIQSVMHRAFRHGEGVTLWSQVYRALYAHLTAPKTKTVWRVSGTWNNGDQAGPADFPTLTMAADAAQSWRREGCHLMNIRDVEVPA